MVLDGRYNGYVFSSVVLGLALFAWLWGFLSGNGIAALIGAGVTGGMLYDVVLNKGKYVLPAPESDGINLGSLYGAIIGFVTAISVLEGALPSTSFPVDKSLTAFLVSLGIKGGSEVAATTRITLLKRSSLIRYDVGGLKQSKDAKIKVGGKLILPDTKEPSAAKDKVILVKLKNKAGFEAIRECLANENGDFSYEFDGIDAGEWESWVSWKGDEDNDAAESEHQLFKVN